MTGNYSKAEALREAAKSRLIPVLAYRARSDQPDDTAEDKCGELAEGCDRRVVDGALVGQPGGEEKHACKDTQDDDPYHEPARIASGLFQGDSKRGGDLLFLLLACGTS